MKILVLFCTVLSLGACAQPDSGLTPHFEGALPIDGVVTFK